MPYSSVVSRVSSFLFFDMASIVREKASLHRQYFLPIFAA